MKKVKIAIWVVLFGLVAILIYQNQAFFMARQIIAFNLLFTEIKTPEIYNVYVCFAFLIAGLLLGLYFLLVHYLKSKKSMKLLTTTVTSQEDRINQLEAQLASRQGATTLVNDVEQTAPDTVAIQPQEKVGEES